MKPFLLALLLLWQSPKPKAAPKPTLAQECEQIHGSWVEKTNTCHVMQPKVPGSCHTFNFNGVCIPNDMGECHIYTTEKEEPLTIDCSKMTTTK